MTTELLITELELLRERAFTVNSPRRLFTDFEDEMEFQAIGDVLKQLSFAFHPQSNQTQA